MTEAQVIGVIQNWATGCTGEHDRDCFFRMYVEGPQGAKYEILKEEHHTKADIERAAKLIQRWFDPVKITVIKLNDLMKNYSYGKNYNLW